MFFPPIFSLLTPPTAPSTGPAVLPELQPPAHPKRSTMIHANYPNVYIGYHLHTSTFRTVAPNEIALLYRQDLQTGQLAGAGVWNINPILSHTLHGNGILTCVHP